MERYLRELQVKTDKFFERTSEINRGSTLGAAGVGEAIVLGTSISVEGHVDHDGRQSEEGLVNFPEVGHDLAKCTKGGIHFALPPTISCGRVRSARRRVDHRGPDQLPRRSGGVGRTRGHELENAFG